MWKSAPAWSGRRSQESHPQSRALKDLPPEQREAARPAAEALGTPVGSDRSGGASKSDVLLDDVIELLMERAGGS